MVPRIPRIAIYSYSALCNSLQSNSLWRSVAAPPGYVGLPQGQGLPQGPPVVEGDPQPRVTRALHHHLRVDGCLGALGRVPDLDQVIPLRVG